MHVYLSTEKLHRIGITKDEIRVAERCCLRRIARGRYVVVRRCEDHAHRQIARIVDEDGFDELVDHDDMRDQVENLKLLVRARAEKIAAASGRRRVAKGHEVFSHLSAALVHGLVVAYPATSRVEVCRPNVNRKYKHLRVRSRAVRRSDQSVVGIYSVTTIDRTLIDVARDYSTDLAVAMIDDALRRSKTSITRLENALDESGGIHGVAAVKTALSLADARREAPSESIAAVRIHEHGIIGFVPQVEFFDECGRVVARVDFCHEDAKVILEIDGLDKYVDSGLSPRRAIAAEKKRQSALEERGYRVIRLGFGQLFQTGPFIHILNVVTSRLRERAILP